MTFEQSRLVSSCFLALVACFYLNQPIEAFGLQGFPTGAIGYPGLRSGYYSLTDFFVKQDKRESSPKLYSDWMVSNALSKML